MTHKNLNRYVGAAVFVYALLIYLMSVAPTASFWDCGEFIAISYGLQVSHPPGAPFYMLLGRIFSMFVPVEWVAFSVNLMSVFSSAFTVLLTYLILVRLVQEWKGDGQNWTVSDQIAVYGGSAIGALTYAVTDSFWFNAVEAEVYALSMLFTALVIWLTFKWVDQVRHDEKNVSEQERHQIGTQASRWLVVIAYLFGLATGVHLLNLLAIFFIAVIVYFEKFDKRDFTVGKRVKNLVITGAISSLLFFAVYPGVIITLPSIAEASGFPVLTLLVFIGLLVFGINYGQKKRIPIVNVALMGLTMIIIGYSSYALIFVRSAADPPIDENDPETTEAIVAYLKREQYGDTPLLRGASYNNRTGRVDDEKLFPRRHSIQSQEHLRVYAEYDSDWDYFWSYQINHMYVRYFMWNFSGKAADVREAPWIVFASQADGYMKRSPSEQKSTNAYFALPFLLGLIGMFWHFRQDWRRALAVGVLFLITGLGIIVYLNQTPLQPRERDYAYVASFFAFALWIGIGATGLIELTVESVGKRLRSATAIGVAALTFLAVPFWMLLENYDDHDRSGQVVAVEYARNMLESVEENAILFTNGDNDTFPLWYLQEVEKVRTDVRVVNLSLLNTPWYVNQLKNQNSRLSEPLPMSFTDAEIQQLEPALIPKEGITQRLPVSESIQSVDSEMQQVLQEMTDIPASIEWTVTGRPYSQDANLLYAADIAVMDILSSNARNGWTRPVYFAVTVSPDGFANTENFHQLEGLALRFVPIEHNDPRGRSVRGITDQRLKNFSFTGLDNPDIYFDENIRTMTDNYRTLFVDTAEALYEDGYEEDARELLDFLMDRVSLDVIPADLFSLYRLSMIYNDLGETEKSNEFLKKAEPVTLNMLKYADNQSVMERAMLFVEQIWISYLRREDFVAAAQFRNKVADLVGDDSFRSTPEELKQLYEDSKEYIAAESTAADAGIPVDTLAP